MSSNWDLSLPPSLIQQQMDRIQRQAPKLLILSGHSRVNFRGSGCLIHSTSFFILQQRHCSTGCPLFDYCLGAPIHLFGLSSRIERTGGVELIDLIYRQYGSSDLIRVVTVGESSVITYHILILSSLILFCLCPWFPLCFRVVQFYSIDQSRCIQLFYCPWPFIFVDLNSPFSKGVVCILHRSLTSQRSHLSNDASADQLNNYFGTRSKWI